mgnify:CR=1 FL=1
MNPEKQWSFIKSDIMPKMEMMNTQLTHLTEFANDQTEDNFVSRKDFEELKDEVKKLNSRLDELFGNTDNDQSIISALKIKKALINEFGKDRFPDL